MASENYLNEFLRTVDDKFSRGQVRYADNDAQVKKIWGKPLYCFEVFADDLFELISHIYNNVKEEATLKYAIATTLGKALLRLEEIVALLWKGYPDGAMALSRSLHELTVCFLFLGKHQNDTSLVERYFCYRTIERYKELIAIKETCEQNGWNFEKARELEQLTTQKSEQTQKYGKSFNNDFGWSFCIEGVNKFSDMENDVGARVVHSCYSLSNSIIHSNPDSNRYSLGSINDNDSDIIAGPSIYGLEIPFSYALISVSAITQGLMMFIHDNKTFAHADALSEIIFQISNILKETSQKKVY